MRCLVLCTLSVRSVRVIVQAPTSLTRRDSQHWSRTVQPPWRARRGNVSPVVFVWGVDERQGYFFVFLFTGGGAVTVRGRHKRFASSTRVRFVLSMLRRS